MAGYDFSFDSPNHLVEATRKWLRSFKKLSRAYNLEVKYRTVASNKRNCKEILVTVDGSLSAMQYIHRILPEETVYYLRYNNNSKSMGRILRTFYSENLKGLKGITKLVFDVSKRHNSEPSGIVTSSYLLSRIGSKNRKSPAVRGIISVITAFDNWLLDRISSENAFIIIDQGMEDWLNSKLTFQKSTRYSFPVVVDKAIDNNIISKWEGYRLKRFHQSRNKIQHRGGKANKNTLISMVDFFLRLANQKY